MEIIAEITPTPHRDLFLKRLQMLKPLVSMVDIPESPLGRPTAHALAAGALARQMGLEPIVHIRLLDLNKTGLKSLLGGAKLLDITHVVLLQGDPPTEGTPVRDVTTEEAVAEAKKTGLKAGALLSLRRDYKRRLEMRADFYLALHFRDVTQLLELPPVIYPYIIVKTEKNSPLVEKMGQEATTPQEAAQLAKRLEGVAPGVVISAPGDFDAMLQVVARLKKRHS
ncbi:MAG: 5,10-methylenetetrahydrofolate reductase [Pyrobaculum sp.]